MFKDYYQILGVQPTATDQEIKQAYRQMSLRWHPDRNPGKDVTQIMQDINEAYMMLKDSVRRARYDNEYLKFARQHADTGTTAASTPADGWDYDYEVDDEDLQKDINEARTYAKDLVDEFLRSLKDTSKIAAKGGWESAKGYVYAAVIIFIVGLCVRTCAQSELARNDWPVEQSEYWAAPADSQTTAEPEDFQAPATWDRYYIANQAFSLSVPPTVELRHDYDNYVKRLNDLGVVCNTDAVVFEQKGLADNTAEAYSHYCRIMIQHFEGNPGDAPPYDEVFALDSQTIADLRQMVGNELGPYELIGQPAYRWVSAGNAKAIETSYRRTGSNGNTTACKIYLLFNSNQMVKMIVSYREQESDIWLPDLDNVIKTFRWR